MSKHQTITFTITQEGKVTLEVNGVNSPECVNITQGLEELIGTVESREFKAEYYQNNVTLQHNQNEIQG
tara:strand:+ start:324 stop:530 length:207 start_codon:yes stop_codon:yes gene_type:complete